MFLFGKINFCKKNLGVISKHDCPYCKNSSYWELCIVNTWFRFLFIPLFPYKTMKCLVCDKCDYCLELGEETFSKLEYQIANNLERTEPEELKYINRNPLQINYIKTLNSTKQ